jgi:hypothetical protein
MRGFVKHLPLLWLATAYAAAADEIPGWLKQAVMIPVPDYPAQVSSVALFQEETVTVDGDGRRVMRERGAVKIIQPGGKKIEAFRTYNAKEGRIRDFQGWIVPPSGKPTTYPRDRIVDVALARNYVYDEARAKVLEAGSLTPGSTFAWEVTEEERTVFTQYTYHFQDRSPGLISRFAITLPAGWEVKGTLFNHDRQEPQVSGNTYSWELRDLPWIEPEDHSPALSALVPRLAVSYFPPSDNRGGLAGLKDWAAVSAWLSSLVDPPADVTGEVRAKAVRLTANAATELEKIKAIGAFVQQTNYVEVALNITRGGGYTPHRAQDTLSRNYGDCKDKATLMRSLLKAVGIESYLLTITSSDRTYVRPEWASPMQFNHAIIAIRVSDAVSLPAVLPETPQGRLLIFDPTDPITPVGDLPQEEQGSHALLIAGARGSLLTMPALPPGARRIESVVEASVGPEGRLEAHMQRQYFGQSATPLRRLETLRGGEEFKKRFEAGVSRRMGGTTVRTVSTASDKEENRLSLNAEFSAERFGQSMQGRLFVLRPGLLTSGGDYFFSSRKRASPIKLSSDLRQDSIRIKLPPGFEVDESPRPMKIESVYGKLEASWVVRDGEAIMNQTLEIREQVVGAAEYAQVRQFFDQLAAAETAPVVLVKR